MSEITDQVDIDDIHFSSDAAPTAEDLKLWDSLTPAMQRAVTIRDLDAAENRGVTEPRSVKEIMAAAQAARRNAL